MAVADRPLAYCSNVHPAASLNDLRVQLERHALPTAAAIGRPLGVGLWLPRSALEVVDEREIASFRDWFLERGLQTTTMNAFPFGDFHAVRVKERVYQPDWTTTERRDFTNRTADFLAALLPEGGVGSISTLPCAYRKLSPNAKASDFFPRLFETADHLARIREQTGKTIRLGLEPEPGCFLERTSDAVRFIQEARNSPSDAVREHLGVCFDVCHSAVMFESPAAAISSLDEAEVPIVKVQISSALELRSPRDRAARKFLSQFVEERYLHQTTAMHEERFLFAEDLSASLALTPPHEWLTASPWRIHFHVPIHKQEIGPLHTTTWAVEEALSAVEKVKDAPDLEVETYTWSVLPAISKTGAPDLAAGLAAEWKHVQGIVDRLQNSV
jgi:sugar phosphate isomerase/epimerase